MAECQTCERWAFAESSKYRCNRLGKQRFAGTRRTEHKHALHHTVTFGQGQNYNMCVWSRSPCLSHLPRPSNALEIVGHKQWQDNSFLQQALSLHGESQ